MSLFAATFVTGCVLVVLGLTIVQANPRLQKHLKAWPRSSVAAVILFGGGVLWFLSHVAQLGEADFGNIRHWLLLLFGGVALGAFFFVRDFLAVRGLAVLLLLSAQPLLQAAFLKEPQSRLLLVAFVYVAILFALYIGTVPYRMRDILNWLFAKARRQQLVGGCFAAYGLLLVAISLKWVFL